MASKSGHEILHVNVPRIVTMVYVMSKSNLMS